MSYGGTPTFSNHVNEKRTSVEAIEEDLRQSWDGLAAHHQEGSKGAMNIQALSGVQAADFITKEMLPLRPNTEGTSAHQNAPSLVDTADFEL